MTSWLSDALNRWGARRELVVIAALGAGVLLLLGWSTNWFPWDYAFAPAFPGLQSGAPQLVLLLLATCPLLALRSVVLATVVGLSPFALLVLGSNSQLPWVQYAALVAAGVVATVHHPRRALLPFAVALVPAVGYVGEFWSLAVPGGGQVESRYGGGAALELGLYVGFTLIAVALAHVARTARRREDARGARADEVEQESAVIAERARLARDLHDVVAHHISLIAVRAETAPFTVPDLSDGARGVLADIADDARRSLDELRHVLGVLRRSGGGSQRTPLPTLADLPELITRVRAAGDLVAVAGLPNAAAGVSATQSYVAYRVIQESLTNARRHAPGAPVSIALALDAERTLEVTVTNPAPVGPVHAASPASSSGRGLLGIRERVDALGGTTEVDHTGGQYAVHVVLPHCVVESRDTPPS